METYPIVIMAGGPTPQKILDAGEKEPERAFIEIGGKPMIKWVVDAVRGCKSCGQILAIGNVDRLVKEGGLAPSEVFPQKSNMLENFIAGMEHFRSSKLVTVATCDIPLITSQALDDLFGLVAGIKAEVYYPIIDVKLCEEKFPGGHRTTQKLKEGTYTGGNIFVLDPEAVIKNRSRVEAVIRDRKSPAKLVKLFGLPFIVKFALKQLDLPGLEKKASEILGAQMRGIITPWPEIGFDVDKPEDLSMVRNVLGHA